MNGGVYNAERWDPATGQWTTLAAQAVTRQYHSTALLLPDGRVLSSGGGICGTCDQVGYLAKNAEIFTPPYLFKKDGSGELAPRPEITGAPGTVGYGTPSRSPRRTPPRSARSALIRLGSQTHSVEMEQRYVPLSFTAGGGTLTASVPANVNTAVPASTCSSSSTRRASRRWRAWSNSTPRRHRRLRHRRRRRRPRRISRRASRSRRRRTGEVHLTGQDVAPGDGRRRRRHRDESRVLQRHDEAGRGHDRAVHAQWNVGAAGTYTLTARATDNTGATATSSSVTVTVAKKK